MMKTQENSASTLVDSEVMNGYFGRDRSMELVNHVHEGVVVD